MMNRHGVCGGLLVGLLGLTAGGCASPLADPENADHPGTTSAAEASANDSPPNGFQLIADWTSPVDVGLLKGYFYVPKLPITIDQQFFSFFPALVNQDGSVYLKPVLAFDGETGWSIYSEYIAPGVDTQQDPLYGVASGDLIYYSIQGFTGSTYCDSSGKCLWRVTIEDVTQHNASVVLDEYLDVSFQWVFGATLTTNGVEVCSELPPSAVNFFGLTVKELGSNAVLTPSWAKGKDSDIFGWTIGIESDSDVQLSPPPDTCGD
jgi:hypothetical protein